MNQVEIAKKILKQGNCIITKKSDGWVFSSCGRIVDYDEYLKVINKKIVICKHCNKEYKEITC